MVEENEDLKEKIVDRQILNLPKEVKFCTRCVMSNQRPRITFNKEGVCSACRYAEYKKTIDWDKRKQELKRLCDKYRSKDGSFDVIVPCSGGKDSSMIAHRLKVEYSMHPLCVTFSPPQYTDIGWKNLRRFIDSGFHHYLVSPAGDLYRALGRMCFELYGDHNEIFDRGQMSAPFRAAVEHNVSLVMYGENGEAEYGGTSDYNESPGLPWEAFEKVYYSENLDEMARLAKELGYVPNIQPHDLDIFRLPPIEKLKDLDIQMHWFGYYTFWEPQEHYYYASKHTGFQSNPEGRLEGTYSNYAQLDDLTDSFLYYMMFVKYGFGRATSDAAHEIREGRITREEGVALVHRYDGEFPAKTYKIFLEHLGITEEQFLKTVNKYRLPHIWKQENCDWKLREQVR